MVFLKYTNRPYSVLNRREKNYTTNLIFYPNKDNIDILLTSSRFSGFFWIVVVSIFSWQMTTSAAAGSVSAIACVKYQMYNKMIAFFPWNRRTKAK